MGWHRGWDCVWVPTVLNLGDDHRTRDPWRGCCGSGSLIDRFFAAWLTGERPQPTFWIATLKITLLHCPRCVE